MGCFFFFRSVVFFLTSCLNFVYLYSKLYMIMPRTIVSTSQLCLSRQQQEFLAKYRTSSARQAYLYSYGEGESNFLDSRYSEVFKKPSVPDVVFPYDYEVEYLEVNENSGVAYIDTEYIPTGMGIYMRASFSVDKFVAPIYCSILNAHKIDNEQYFRLFQYGNSPSALGASYAGSFTSVFNISLHEQQLFEFIPGGSYIINDVEGTFHNFKNLPNTAPMLLFGYSNDTLYYGRFYSFFISDNGVSMVDMIPVSKDGVGYMYDKVSEQLFGAQGGGSFVVGPRKA